MTKKIWLQCRARTRKGTPCKCMRVPGKKRCKYHGGLSTGAKTPEGKAMVTKNLEKARQVLMGKPREWHRAKGLKAAETMRKRRQIAELKEKRKQQDEMFVGGHKGVECD